MAGFVGRSLALAAVIMLVAAQGAADVRVTLDTRFATAVLEDVCSGNPIDEDGIRASRAAQRMVAHFAQFRDYFTMDAYVAARQRAANCEQVERDIFRFNAIVEDKATVAAQLTALSVDNTGLSKAMGRMLAPYVPHGLSYDGSAVIMVGTPSCGGWSDGPAFYVDLPCLNGDQQGLIYLVAHESYHGMQDLFMPDVEAEGPLVRMLSQMMREGSATAVADFSQIKEPGSYSEFSQEVIRRNARRVAENFQLLEIISSYLILDDTGDRYAAVNNIGLSGAYGAPLYYVGATMVRALEESYGRQVLVCLLASPPADFVAAYHGLAQVSPDLPSIGATLGTWLERQPAADRDCLP